MWQTGARFAILGTAMLLGIATSTAVANEEADHVRVPLTAQAVVEPRETVVRPGDHLWKISEQHMELVKGPQVTSSDVAKYWREVVTVNTQTLRSGDPDLIFPGEVVVLPKVSG